MVLEKGVMDSQYIGELQGSDIIFSGRIMDIMDKFI